MARSVTLDQLPVKMPEKDTVTLICTYETSSFSYSLFWYKQPSSGAVILLIHQDSYSQENATEDRYSLNFQKANKSIQLVISDAQVEDSAVYFCALSEPTVRAPGHNHSTFSFDEFDYFRQPMTNLWRLSNPGWSSDPFRNGYPDCELYLFSHRLPPSFLVCSISWRTSTAPSESHEAQQ